jgi:hypothetical protein
MAPDRVSAVELVVNELAVNSVRHGGGSGTLRIWVEDGAFTCEITDDGHLTDPLAGRRHVGLGTNGQRGLLIAHDASDLIRLHTTPTGTTIRAQFTVLCFYTDGLIERRDSSINSGISRLRDAVYAGPPEEVSAAVMAALIGREPAEDDVALLLIRRAPGEPGHTLT